MPIELIKKSLIFVTENNLFVNEKQIRDVLCDHLNHRTDRDNWNWSIEEPFQTDCLVNNERVSFDIMGQRCNGSGENEAFLVELKYVPINIEKNTPHDPPAFAYDVLKDCVKIELAIGGRAIRNEFFSKISGVSIGVTNYPRYWQGRKFRNWAENYLNAINPIMNEELIFDGLIHTVFNDGNKYSRIYKNKRCHISLGLKWIGDWFDLHGMHAGFRCFNVSPVTDVFLYRHTDIDSDTIPFLDLRTKNKFDKICFSSQCKDI